MGEAVPGRSGGAGSAPPLLKYGDQVAFFSSDYNGYVFTDGHVDPDVYVGCLEDSVEFPPNLSECKFEVVIRFQWTAVKATSQYLLDMGKERASYVSSEAGMHDETLQRLLSDEVRERARNVVENSRMKGGFVTYGMVVQLRHTFSGMFVTVAKHVSPSNNKALHVCLSSGDEGSLFVINPSYKTFPHHFFSCNTLPGPAPRLMHHEVDRLSVNAGGAGAMTLRVMPVVRYAAPSQSATPDLDKIHGEQVIALFHKEEACFLSDSEEASPRFVKAEDVSGADAVIDSNHYWKIEKVDVQLAGETCVYGETFRLKHVASGMYLASRKEKEGVKRRFRLPKQFRRKKTATPHQILGEHDVHEEGVEVALTNEYNDLHAQWSFAPFLDEDSGDIPANSVCYVVNAADGGILVEDGLWAPEHTDATTQESERRRYHRVLTGQFKARDAMQVMAIPSDHVSHLSAIIKSFKALSNFKTGLEKASNLSELKTLCEDSGGVIKKVLSSIIMQSSMSDNVDPMTRQGIPNDTVLNLLREQELNEFISPIITIPFDKHGVKISGNSESSIDHPSLSVLKEIVKLTYRVIRAFCRGSVENKHIMETHIDRMQAHLPGSFFAAGALMEIFHNNIDLLTHRVDETMIKKFVSLLKARKSAGYVRFLEYLVVADGQPLTLNQNKVIEHFLPVSEDSFSLILNARLEHTDSYLPAEARREMALSGADTPKKRFEYALFIQDPSADKDWLLVNEYYGYADQIEVKNPDSLTEEEALYRYHIQCLHLIAALCLGRSRLAFERLVMLSARFSLGYYDLLKIVFHPYLPYNLRMAYCAILQNLYVDRDPHVRALPIRLARSTQSPNPSGVTAVPGDMTDPYSSPSLSPFRPTHGFRDLKTLLLSYVMDLGRFDAHYKGRNRLTLQVLSMMETMVKFGLFALRPHGSRGPPGDIELGRLIPELLNILDGTNDLPKGGQRYVITEGNEIVARCKLAVLSILEYVTELIVNIRLDLVFDRFRDYAKEEENARSRSRSIHRASVAHRASIYGQPLDEPLLENVGDDVGCLARRRSDAAVSRKEESDDEVEMEDMSLQIDFTKFGPAGPSRREWAHLEERSFGQAHVHPLLLVDPKKNETSLLSSILLDLTCYENKELVVRAFMMLSRHMQQRVDLIHIARERVMPVASLAGSDLLTMASSLANKMRSINKFVAPAARALLVSRTGEDSHAIMLDIFEKLRKLVVGVPDGESAQFPQDILRSLGIHDLTLEILQLPLEVGQASGRLLEVFQAALNFLSDFCRGNEACQLALSSSMRILYNLLGTPNLNVADTIAEIIRNSSQFLASIDFDTIGRFVDLMLDVGKNARWMRFFNTLLAIHNEPVRQTQGPLLKTLLDNDLVDVGVLQDKKAFNSLVQARDHSKELGSQLRYCAEAVTFMALCCAGKMGTNEAKCRHMMPMSLAADALLKTIPAVGSGWQKELHFLRKAIVKFVWKVYVETKNPAAFAALLEPGSGFIGQGSIMEGIVEETRRISREGRPPVEMIDYVFDVVVPMTTDIYKYCYVHMDDTARVQFNKHAESIVISANDIHITGISAQQPERQWNAWRALIRTTIAHKAMPSEPFQPIQAAEPGFAGGLGPDLDAQCQVSWQSFIMDFGKHLGIADFDRMMGVGLRHFAEVLARGPNKRYVKNLVHFILGHPELQEQSDFVTQVLRAVRASMFCDPKLSASEADQQWQAFVDNREAPHSSEYELRKKQKNFAEMGLAALSAEMMLSKDPALRAASMHTLRALLQGGNRSVQNALSDHFARTPTTQFFVAARTILVMDMDALSDRYPDSLPLSRLGDGDDHEEGMVPYSSNAVYRRSLGGWTAWCSPNDEQDQHYSSEDGMASDLRKPLISEELLEILSLMVEGRHTDMQSQMVAQPDNFNNVDLMGVTADFVLQSLSYLEKAIQTLDTPVIDLFIRAFEFLERCVQGPHLGNQQSLASSMIFEAFNRAMETTMDCEEAILLPVSKVRSNAVRTMLAILEGGDRGLAGVVLSKVDWAVVVRNLSNGLEFLGSPKRSGIVVGLYDTLTEEVSNCIVLAHRLQDCDPPVTGKLRCACYLTEGCERLGRVEGECVFHAVMNLDGAVDHFESNVASVEMVKNRKVEVVYFHTYFMRQFETALQALKYDMKDRVEACYDASVASRMRNLMEILPELVYEVQHSERLGSITLTSYIPRWFRRCRLAAMVFSVIIACLSMCQRDSYRWTLLSTALDVELFLAKILMLVHIFVSFSVAWMYLVLSSKPVVFRRMRRLGEFHDKATVEELEMRQTGTMAYIHPVAKWNLNFLYLMVPWNEGPLSLLSYDLEVYYFLGYPLFSLVGGLASPLAFAYHLLDFLQDPVVKSVVSAVTNNVGKIFKTGLLAAMFLFFFAIVAFFSFNDDFEFCGSLYECFLKFTWVAVLGEPLYEDWGSTDLPASIFHPGSDKYPWHNIGLALFTATFAVVFVIILMAIISGIIIDGFGSMRDAAAEVKDAIESSCFCCNLSRFVIDEEAEGFDTHVTRSHNYWDYVRVFAYIEQRKPSLLTGPEQSLRDALSAHSLDMFPIGKSHAYSVRKRATEAANIGPAAEDLNSLRAEVAALRELVSQGLTKSSSRRE